MQQDRQSGWQDSYCQSALTDRIKRQRGDVVGVLCFDLGWYMSQLTKVIQVRGLHAQAWCHKC